MRLLLSLLLFALPAFAQEEKPAVLDEVDEEVITGSVPKRAPDLTAQTGQLNSSDIAIVKRAVNLVRSKDFNDALALRNQATDPAAKLLIEMLSYRGGEPTSRQLLSFLNANQSFLGNGALRRKLEIKLYDEGDLAGGGELFAKMKPLTAKGKMLQAKILAQKGDRLNALSFAKEAFTAHDFGERDENALVASFPALNSREMWRARMDYLLEQGEYASAQRSASKIGEGEVALVKLRSAFDDNKAPPRTYYNAVPSSHQRDPHFLLAKAQLHRRADEASLAAPILISANGHNSDYWMERRIVARQMLDGGDARTAYKVAASHHGKGADQLDADFYAGFIALRYLNDPQTAIRHFDKGARSSTYPSSQARLAYWLGRAYEQIGSKAYAQQSYNYAAKHTSSYYGQLANEKLERQLTLRTSPASALTREGFAKMAGARGLSYLYAAGEVDMARGLLADFAAQMQNGEQVSLLAALPRAMGDARGELLVGKLGQQRGFLIDDAAFPVVGIPAYKAVEGSADKQVVYAIARQESTFDPRAQSGAGAMGLLQLMPATAAKTASRAGLAYEKSRLISDPAFNAQLGAAHLGELLEDTRGSFILTFAGYNAGSKKASDWVEKFGDPRTGKIDPIDFVERIPFSETRLYVQKVMENMQIYKVRFGASRTTIEADLKRGRVN